MIDTDKYEGHTPGPWEIHGDYIWTPVDNVGGNIATVTHRGVLSDNEPNKQLIADAPLLLAEVKRLRAWKKLVSDIVQQQYGSHLREMLKEMIE